MWLFKTVKIDSIEIGLLLRFNRVGLVFVWVKLSLSPLTVTTMKTFEKRVNSARREYPSVQNTQVYVLLPNYRSSISKTLHNLCWVL